MKDVAEIFNKFREVIAKYNLEDKADEISEYIVSKDKAHFSIDDFAEKFKLDKKDAKIILDTIYKAIEIREKHLT